MKRYKNLSVFFHTLSDTRCGKIGMMLFAAVCLWSCVDEATLEVTNYEPVSIQTNAANTITSTTAKVNADFTASIDRTITRGICAGRFQNPTNIDIDYHEEGKLGNFSVLFYGLQPGTTYYARAYTYNSVGEIEYGNQISFVTLSASGMPVLTTTTPGSITSSTAQTGGNITSDGGYSITSRGVCWNTTTAPTILNSKTSNGSGTGTFTSSMTGLTPNVTYYVRAYATNSSGTSYGNEVTFTTINSVGLPALLTTTPSAVTGNSATSGGTITSDGGYSITSRGVCWSTTTAPTILNTKTADGSGTGTFTSSITGLTANTTYYVRAYATNVYGTAYGTEMILKTSTSTVTDIDGNIYHTVTIGTQVWMVENLKTTRYNDGTVIPLVTDTTTWKNLTTPGYCWFNNDLTTYKNTYGAMYNWFAVNTGKLAPTGWHIPTDAEWTTLTAYLGGVSVAGGKLKEAGTSHWSSPNTGATNESGFTGLPGGWRNLSPTLYYSIGYDATWWSSTAGSSANSAWCRDMTYSDGNLTSASYDVNYGFSVRCIKN